MPVPAIYRLSSIVTPAGTIHQIQDSAVDAGIEEMLVGGSAMTDPTYSAVGIAKPMITFSTTAVATALGVSAFAAYPITGAMTLYFAAVAPGGIISASSVHLKLSISSGLLVPKSIEARQGKEPAKIDYEIYPLSSDGLTSPFTITTGQTLPTQTGVSELFTIGPASLNATAFNAVQSLKWEFGMKCEIVFGDGEPFPTFAGITQRKPKGTIEGVDMTAVSGFGLSGTALTSFATYLRKTTKGALRVAAATAQHIKMSGTAGMAIQRKAGGSYENPQSATYEILPTYDGTNDNLALSVASAIT
jgi:hypothetical protein